jgi:DNA end-binding protein Ku
MARAIWSGSISFGLVSVPVKVYSAVREHTVHFHQVEKGTGARIRYEKVSERSGEEVNSKDIELGYELAKGRMVTVDPDDLAELQPRTTKSIDISDFVDLSEIDPVFYNRTYWLGPDGESAERPYSLLVQAMQDRHRAGIGMVVMRNKQYLAAIRPREGALAMSTMYFADEVVPKSDVDGLPSRHTAPAPKEVRLAVQIIDALRGDWDPGRYKDTYTKQVKDLIERQAEGKHIVVDESPAETAHVVDLVAALEASLKAAGKAGGSRASKLRELEKAASQVGEDDDKDKSAKPKAAKGSRSTAGKRSSARKTPARKSA